jgi:cytoskeletal protein CcmA (bactofilin family)
MFRRRKDESGGTTIENATESGSPDLPTLKPFLRTGVDDASAARPAAVPATPAVARPDLPRRLVDLPGAPARAIGLPGSASAIGASIAASGSVPAPSENESKKLIVGRDIKLHGEITSCDHLLVEGSVEATLNDGKIIDIAQSGTFTGSVECETASVRGKFEGDLTCHERLVVRSTGRIIGKIRYRQLEVERGGEISGDVQMLQSTSQGGSTVTPIFGESEDKDPIAAVISGDR